eukprot:CAMPEP_0198509930 /NCGR_PEP_ID=MMETSP1462-20131121/13874_1 /TAXON_ID=1333877 /ORGANISM="Brandtodinium nutriculum, Strain RCC3387" /LENGTH=52 /DNA_ID=CAMNT_0044239251 /DNA_START=22 /DNA_END=180 /DNA_ORIENTATION=+
MPIGAESRARYLYGLSTRVKWKARSAYRGTMRSYKILRDSADVNMLSTRPSW